MLSLGRVAAAFLLMMVVGYIAIVVLVPAPAGSGDGRADDGGIGAAARLTQQAQALVGTAKSATTLR